MGLRARIIVYVVAAALVTFLIAGSISSSRQAKKLHAATVDHGLEVLRALAAPCSVPLATGEIEELDRTLARFAADGDWGRLDMLEVSILDAQGRIVAHTDPHRFGRSQDDPFSWAARAATAPTAQPIETEQGRQLRLSMPIVSGLRWGTATATLSLERVDQWVAKSRREALILSAITATLIGLLLYILVSALVLRPMQDLTDAVQRLADGDLDARVVDRARSPEFSLLSGVFNDLAKRISESTRRLEGQVQERTRALEVANAELERLAATDGLTGLANRRARQSQLRNELARAARDGTRLSLLMVDVDHFKAFNDTHGHPEGDAVLVGIAEVLGRRLRSTDLAARYGGEEFAALLPNTARADARRVAAKLVSAVRDQHFRGGQSQPSGRVTISVGVATWSGGDESAEAFVARADAALYQAKNAGRDRVAEHGGAA